MIRRITIVQIKKPKQHSINEELQWFGNALGLFGERDSNKSCFRIFIELLKATKSHEGLTSDELAERLTLTRPTVIHHLNSLMDKGIVVHQMNRYVMRGDKLSELIEDIHKDMDRAFEDMKRSAEELDRFLGL